MKNSLLFRFVWFVLTLPLEIARLIIIPIVYAIHTLVLPRGVVLWVILALSYFALTPSVNHAQDVAFQTFLVDSLVFWMVIRCFRRFILTAFRVPYPKWRLSAREAVPKRFIMPVVAVVEMTHGRKQTRQKMTGRLSLDLQELMKAL